MPFPIVQDLSPSGSDCSPCSPAKDKVSRWKQSILSSLPGERSRAYTLGAVAAKSMAASPEKDALDGWLLTAHGVHARQKSRGDQCSRCCGKETSGSDAEEEDWELHRQKTGLVAKLVLYDSSERLLADFQLRPGIRRSGAVVLKVVPGGPCDRAGVRAGDRLVSVNGRQDPNFQNLKVEEGPTKLIFMGTAGKITTEVRLVSGDSSSMNKGFTLLSDKVWGGAKTKFLFQEERVFVPSLASLALGVQDEPSRTPQMFSLERTEAAHLLRCAKNEAEAQLRLGPSRASAGDVSPIKCKAVNAAELSQQELWVEVGAKPASPQRQQVAGHCPIGPKREWRKEAKHSKELTGDFEESGEEMEEML